MAPAITPPPDCRTPCNPAPPEPEQPAEASPLGWDEPIYIPEPARRFPLRGFEPSVPTLYFLNHHDFWMAGDLHGRSYRELRRRSGCDLGIIRELRHLVDALRRRHGVSPADVRAERSSRQLKPPRRVRKFVPRSRRPHGDGRPVPEPWPDQFAVPEKARSWDPQTLPLPLRVQNLLRRRGIGRLGELDGLSSAELWETEGCGAGTLGTLHRFLQQAAAGEAEPVARCFDVPEKIRAWSVFELPLSARLENALRGLGIALAGELQGMPFLNLRAVGRCGRTTLAELQQVLARAAEGEFDPPSRRAGWQPKALLQILDKLVGFLPDRACQILCDRLGAESGNKETLDAIASRAGLSRERVRQMVLFSVIRIRKSGSVPLKFHLERLQARCNVGRRALSPGLLARWLDAVSGPHQFALPFYVRLIARLEPGIKVAGV